MLLTCQFSHVNTHMSVLVRIAVTQKQEYFSLLILEFYSLHIYPSVDFLSEYLTASPEEIFYMHIEKPFTFFKVKEGINVGFIVTRYKCDNLLSFNY